MSDTALPRPCPTILQGQAPAKAGAQWFWHGHFHFSLFVAQTIGRGARVRFVAIAFWGKSLMAYPRSPVNNGSGYRHGWVAWRPKMLTFDWTGLTEAEMEGLLVERCSPFGCVTVAAVSLPDDRRKVGSAVIRMPSIDEADALARYLGDARRGAEVTIRLVQRADAESGTGEFSRFFGLVTQPAWLDIPL